MPPLDDIIEDLEPSTDPTLDEQAAKSAKPDPAASSAATGENDDTDLLSVVRDVVKESREPSAAASPAEGSEEGGEPADADKPDDEDYSDVPFHKHPRFQQLLRKSKAFEQDAGRYQNVTKFLDNVGLSDAEAADGLEILGLMKTNPAEAWKRALPQLQALAIAAGEVLPQELQARVQAGEITQQAAFEISRANAQAQSVQRMQSFREQREQRSTETQIAQAITDAAVSWEQDRLAKDPNFAAKQEQLLREVAFLQTKEGRPKTPQGVKEQLQKAYKAVNERFVPPAPVQVPRPAVKPVNGGQKAGNQQPANMSTMDIIRANTSRRA